MDEFTKAYVAAALWSSTDEAGELLEANFSADDLAPDTESAMIADCAAFQESSAAMLRKAGSAEQNGHDLWLSRNGHGAGFWSRGYDDGTGEGLTAAALSYGSCELYVGDDGLICLA